jgi:serine-type D-Ala-D-Ala carboxypeptidase (penicillin-binding protein 5/6)
MDSENTNKKQNFWAWPISCGIMVLIFFVLFFGIYLKQESKSEIAETNQNLKPQILGVSTQISALANPQVEPVEIQLSDADLKNIKISARSFLIFSLNKNKEIYSFNSEQKLPIASLTKLMTGLVAYEKLKFSDVSELRENFTKIKPTLNLKNNIKYKIEDLFNSMIIGSANDAGQALASIIEKNTGQNITDLMNQYAKSLSMQNTHFANPTGFDSAYNYSTANDIKKLVAYTQKLYAFTSLGKRQKYEFTDNSANQYRIFSTNKLLKKYSEISSIKTGYTDYALGSIIIKASLYGEDIVFIVLGSQDREADAEKLLNLVKDKLAN